MAKRQQSAMEYLMTYGWSILIIAIVLAALFSLGVFGNSNLGPRAQANSCRVFRPNGPDTTTNVNLDGVCNGELPQYVAQFTSSPGTYIVTGTNSLPVGASARSIFAWIYPTSVSGNIYMIYSYGSHSSYQQVLFYINPSGQLVIDGYADAANSGALTLTANQWHFVGFTYNGGTTVTLYVDGSSTSATLPSSALNTVIPSGYAASTIGTQYDSPGQFYRFWPGDIANVQVYSAALDANAIQALYTEGIGGAPVEPQNIVAWWPLNGDTNDYAGNANTGVSTNVIFTSSWASGYTTP